MTRQPGLTIAISDTGPLLSAFQSDSIPLLTRLFAEIHLPAACAEELRLHGWQAELDATSDGLVIVQLTAAEERRANALARRAAAGVGGASTHAGEAHAMILAARQAYQHDVLLLDELAARAVARELKLNVSGFPGVLLLAVRTGLTSAADLKSRLERCRDQGNHYGREFIEQVYDMARGGYG